MPCHKCLGCCKHTSLCDSLWVWKIQYGLLIHFESTTSCAISRPFFKTWVNFVKNYWCPVKKIRVNRPQVADDFQMVPQVAQLSFKIKVGENRCVLVFLLLDIFVLVRQSSRYSFILLPFLSQSLLSLRTHRRRESGGRWPS